MKNGYFLTRFFISRSLSATAAKFAAMEYDETVYACALNRIFNFNSRCAKTLTEKFPAPSEIFSLSRTELGRIVGFGGYVDAILDKDYLRMAEKEVEWARAHGIRIIYIKDREYPARLRECPDAPAVLFMKGQKETDLNPARAVAIVGTRKASQYGLTQCRKIIEHLSSLREKPVIISGLAYGIDICAHLTAMECSMQTIAVLPTGLDSIYPAAHRGHAVRITGQGGLVTDFPKGSTPHPVTFLRRNRIIAGMSDAVILVESAAKGGGMTTARLAQSYSREVLAVPGRMTDKYSEGCNILIRDNTAAIISSPSDTTKIMNWEDIVSEDFNIRLQKIFDNCGYIKRNILLALAAETTVDRDTLIEKTGGRPAEILPELTELELDGIVGTDIYGNYCLKLK